MASTNIVSFKADLGKLQEKFKLTKRTVMQKVSIDIWNGMTQRAPVDTGRFRANFHLTEGAPSSEVNLYPGAKTGEVPPPETPDADQISGDAPVYIVNNLVYAEPLENGHSKQAPNGYRALTLQAVAARVEAAINS